jgi:hypothetical protein
MVCPAAHLAMAKIRAQARVQSRQPWKRSNALWFQGRVSTLLCQRIEMTGRVDLRKLHNACTSARKQKARFDERANYLILLGWPMGLEPTTTGITILDSTN